MKRLLAKLGWWLVNRYDPVEPKPVDWDKELSKVRTDLEAEIFNPSETPLFPLRSEFNEDFRDDAKRYWIDSLTHAKK